MSIPFSPDDDRTVVPQGGRSSPSKGPRDALDSTDAIALQAGARLDEFEIKSLIASGGFGIVYLAYDHSLHRHVAIKEYMPSAYAARTSDRTVAANSSRHAGTFRAGLRSFINEAQLLAQFDHPSLLKVYRFWEANGTGYMVMPVYEGVTLKQALQEHRIRPDEVWLKSFLKQLLEALDVLHRARCFHRDIAPDNILLLNDGRPLLLDFGAARRVISDMTQALTVMLKPGYAPLEQYAETPSMKQGAWTDIYALAAVVYDAITGQKPVPSVARLTSDPLVPLVEAGAGRYSKGFLRALDAALAVRPEDRPQDIASFRRLLELDAREEAPREAFQPQQTTAAPVDPDLRRLRYRRWILSGLGATAVLVALSGGYVFWESWTSQDAATKLNAALDKTPSVIPQSQPTEEPRVPAPPATTAPTVATAPPPPSGPFDPVQALEEVYQGRDPSFEVSVAVDKPQVRIGKDKLRISITSSRPGYVYVLVVGTSRLDFFRLFPNAADTDNRIGANEPFKIPRRKQLDANGPPGTNRFVAVVSDSPRNFSALGTRRNDIFEEFPLDVAAKLQRTNTARKPLFAGQPACIGDTKCSEAYGAAEFSIEEIAE